MASRDFLGGFGRDGGQAPAGGGAAAGAGGESDEIELSLGLSLGGCFGADPSQDGKRLRLQRSSSIASICSLPAATSCGGAQDAAAAHATAPPPDQQLLRTSSLPAEYMEDRLRRRAMQSQRRLEAKRKRLERRNSMNSGWPVPAAGGGAAGRDEGLEHTVPTGFQLRRTVAALTTAGSPTPSRPQQGLAEPRGETSSPADAPPSSDGMSIGQSSNSPIPKEATTAGGRPSSDGAAAGHEQQPPPPTPPLRTLRSLTMWTASTGDLRNTMAEDMPMVSYKAAEGGPSGVGGRKTDGFLYKYRKGEEVRIMCVCHGSFLTPAEFVKHAGGGEVTNPLRHIVINPQQQWRTQLLSTGGSGGDTSGGEGKGSAIS